jgi:hypothetical protein
MKIRKLFIFSFMLLLFSMVAFAWDTSPPGLDPIVDGIEYSVSDQNISVDAVIIAGQVVIQTICTGEGIMLDYPIDVANDLTQFSEASNDICNSLCSTLLVNNELDLKLYANRSMDLYSNQWNNRISDNLVESPFYRQGVGDILEWASL